MGHKFSEIAFTPRVRAIQEAEGSRKSYARFDGGPDHHDRLGTTEAQFIAARDSFYMATVSETGWPYVQHRGGPKGFVRVLDNATLGLADFRGNRQYVSLGNVLNDDRVSLFFMNYPNRTRLKVLGRLKVIDAGDQETLSQLQVPGLEDRTERGFVIKVEAFDWNCPQYITPRFTIEDIQEATRTLQKRIVELESEVARLSGELSP